MSLSLNSNEVDALVEYFRKEPRYVAIAATYITPKDPNCVRVVSKVLERAILDQRTR